MHVYIHTYIHTYMHTYIHTYIHTYMHTYIRIYINLYKFTDIYPILYIVALNPQTLRAGSDADAAQNRSRSGEISLSECLEKFAEVEQVCNSVLTQY